MRKSTLISIALHIAILLWALVAFPAGKIDPAAGRIPIDILTPSEFTKIKAGTADAKDDAPLAGKPNEPRPEAVKEPSKPRKSRRAADQPAPKPRPRGEARAEAPKPEPKAEAKKAEEKPAKPRQARPRRRNRRRPRQEA